MTRHEFKAMGTWFEVHSHRHPDACESFVAACEARFSRFLPSSELSRLNADPEARRSLGREMADVLGVAAEMRDRTGGLVDIGVGSAMKAWGYDRPFASGVGRSDLPGHVPPPTWSVSGRSVEFAPGVTLDLGGIAKGWTADQLVERDIASIASAGGDLRSVDPGLVVEVVGGSTQVDLPVGIGALATSSTQRRTWRAAGRQVNHIIDPRTMKPTDSPIVTATVVAETAVEAEAGAKAVLLLGAEGLAWASDQAWIRQAIAFWDDGSVFATKVRAAA